MGRDKALLADATYGTLLERQLALVASLRPAEILISCRAEQNLPLPTTARRIHDAGTAGPLAGVAALLEAMRGDLLLVLAIDLAKMTPDWLAHLAAAAAPGRGVVSRSPRGLEPLAAIYPRALASEARARLERGTDLSMHGFVAAGIELGLLGCIEPGASGADVFTNWNTPDDLAP